MSESEGFINNMKHLLTVLGNAREMSDVLSVDATEMGGEWQQEIAADLDDINIRLDSLIEDLSDMIAEAKAIQERTEEDIEAALSTDDEELDKYEAEHLQERLKVKQWRKAKRERGS